MSKIVLTTNQILNLCEFAGIGIDINKCVFKEEPDQIDTEYAIEQNNFGAVAYLEEYSEEGMYPLSGKPHILKKAKNKKLQTDAQGAGCPHCGHYCIGKTAFCNPPIAERR